MIGTGAKIGQKLYFTVRPRHWEVRNRSLTTRPR